MHQSVAEGPYTENYQQPIDSSYGRGFGAPAPFQPSPPPAYQPAPPPQMFIPTPTPQAPQVFCCLYLDLFNVKDNSLCSSLACIDIFECMYVCVFPDLQYPLCAKT